MTYDTAYSCRYCGHCRLGRNRTGALDRVCAHAELPVQYNHVSGEPLWRGVRRDACRLKHPGVPCPMFTNDFRRRSWLGRIWHAVSWVLWDGSEPPKPPEG
jgi:hypothetical protein